ncbi:hypothetical protein FQN51_004999 [Onygenales sp. PD_10]|nr:hypothetical protein FQN51_004999 [Onygenales sp. PD_10]
MQAHNPPMAVPTHILHTPYNILRGRPPPLLTREPYQTQSSALHRSYYAKTITDWDISEDVKMVTAEKYLCSSPLDASVDVVSQNPCRVKNEHYLCGDEQTVCGRYSDNALKPVTAVALQQGIYMRFGDYKVCQENLDPDNKGYIPDFVGVACPARDLMSLQNLVADDPTHQPKMRIVGEAKTPWKHDLKTFWNRWKQAKEHQYIQQALGQIAAYMHIFKMRYGFLTTYNYTIFVTQHLVGKEPVLSITAPVPARPTSTENLSVRQYLYYLMYCANNGNNYKFENPCPFNEWVTGDPKDIAPQDPVTPIAKHTVMDEYYQMTPAPETEPLETSRLPLYASRSEGWYSTMLQYPTRRIYDIDCNPYVKINERNIEVDLFEDTGSQSLGYGNDGAGSYSIGRPEYGHAPRKISQQGPNLLSTGMKYSGGMSLMDKFKGAENRSTADTPFARQGSRGGVDHHSSASHMPVGHSPFLAERSGSQQGRYALTGRGTGSEFHRFSPLRGQETAPRDSLRSTEPEEAARREVAEENQQQMVAAVAASDEKTLAHHGGPPKKDDDRGRRSLKTAPTLATHRDRRYKGQ